MSRKANHNEPDVLGPVRLVLPKVIYAVSGIETNVYFDNVVLVVNPANYVFRVSCAKGRLQAERWTFVPLAEDVGEHVLVLEVIDEDNAVIARGSSTVRVVSAEAGAGRSIAMLCIGDSLTYQSVYTGHLLELCGSVGQPRLRLIGTHVSTDLKMPPENRHEGYGGWTAEAFVTAYTGVARTSNYRECGSPFLYEGADGKPQLDFARYIRETNDGKAPDVVTIFLGANDIFHATEENLPQHVERMMRYYDQLLAMIHGFSRKIKIGAVLPPPPAASQDAFGSNYGCLQTRWQYKRNQHRVVEVMTERYGGREKENLWLVPAGTNVDCVHNYPQATKPWNSRTSQEGARLDIGVDRSAEGYRQIGDAIYCWMKAVVG